MSKRKRGRTAKPQASFKVRPKTARSGEHNRLRACGIFDAIFVPATKGPAQTLMYPISSDRKLLLGRRLSPRCIPSPPALSFQGAPVLHRYQARNLFR